MAVALRVQEELSGEDWLHLPEDGGWGAMSQLPLLPSPYVPMGSHSPTDSSLPHVFYMQSQTAGLTGAELGLEGAARDLRRALEVWFSAGVGGDSHGP